MTASEEMKFNKIEPNVWKPVKVGDSLVGEYVRRDDSNKYEGSKVYHFEQKLKTGEVKQSVVFGTTVLEDRMGFAKPGDTVKLVYQGTKKNQKGQDTKIFDVYIAEKK